MHLPFGLEIRRRSRTPIETKQASWLSSVRGWWPVWPSVREPYTGAWQRNAETTTESVLSYFAVYACVSLIATDIGKMRLRLMQRTKDGIWTEIESPAFSPVLRKPNHYQNRVKFVEWWIISKLLWGNTYALKVRDKRGQVVELHLIDPSRTRPLVAPDGSVFYEVAPDALAHVDESKIVPAREIIHDVGVALYHPLIGVSPLYACAKAATQGLSIQTNSTDFFSNGSNPGGVITAPGDISQETADRIKSYWDTEFSGANAGKVAVLGQGLKYEAMTVSASDAQLIEQLKWTADVVCACYHVPPHKIGVGPIPAYNNIEALDRQYYSQCLQTLIESFEIALDEGIEVPRTAEKEYGTELDRDDLISMDTATKMQTARDGVGSGIFSPDEARAKFSLPPVKGGNTPYLQQQNYSLEALARRDKESGAPTSTKPAEQEPEPEPKPKPKPEDGSESDDDAEMNDVRAALASRLVRMMTDYSGADNVA